MPENHCSLTVNVLDYLSQSEIKSLCADYVRELLRGRSDFNKERVLYNIAYNAAFAIMDSVLTGDDMRKVREKVKAVIIDPGSYGIFRKKDAWGAEDSPAYLELLRATEEHKHLISPLVKQAIEQHNYENDLPTAEYIGEAILAALAIGLQTNSSK